MSCSTSTWPLQATHRTDADADDGYRERLCHFLRQGGHFTQAVQGQGFAWGGLLAHSVLTQSQP